MFSHRLLFLVRATWPAVALSLEKLWETPETLAYEILALFKSSPYWDDEILQRVEVTGSPDHLILCIADKDHVLFCSSQRETHLIHHPFMSEIREHCNVSFDEYLLDPTGICLVTSLSDRLKARLDLPSVLLVSLFHPEMYPAARLTLGIAYLASYLRRHHLARVELLDCQFGHGVADVVERIRQTRPAIVGISVNFGQFDLMEQLLKSIYDPQEGGQPPVVVLGNILPAMCFREILRVYPEVVICRKEGELTLAALVKYGPDRSFWNEVPGAYYRDQSGRLVTTPPRYLPMEHLPPPALDTLPNLFEHDGVITAEFSRGCQYNQCSFCPRSHKGGIWRTVPVGSMLQHWEVFSHAFRYFGRTPHVFLADEDFVGKDDGPATIQRITDFLDAAQELHFQITFDASCRADQIFRSDADRDWHLNRGQLFKHCVDKGLARLFLGVESGASEQLLRYNKGSTVDEMVSAIRYLSLLGVKLRFGFIFFDPLMSVQDLLENIEFLGRTDVILSPLEERSVEEIFSLVSSNHRQEIAGVVGKAVFEEVSYMVSPLEVLAKSRYLFDLRGQASHLINEQIDVSFARYPTSYIVPEIGLICKACQYWVNYCFPIVYTLKGLQKISQGEEQTLLRRVISSHRYLGYTLIRDLAAIFSLVDQATLHRWEKAHPGPDRSENLYALARHLVLEGRQEEAIHGILSWYEMQIQRIMKQVNAQIAVLSPSKQLVWQTSYATWSTASLSQTQAFRIA